jgi:hypothetical protein
MANMSDFLEKKLLNHVFRGQSYTAPSSIYIALCNDTITDDMAGADLPEINGTGYTRKQVTTSQWTDPNADPDQIIKNNAEIKWENVQWEDTVTAIALCTTQARLSGDVLFWGELTKEKIVTKDDSISFAANSLSIQIDN